MGSIKNVGIQPVENIIKERNENGKFQSFTDFCERIADASVNKKCIESLIKSGAFDEFEQNRSTLLASFEGIVDTIQSTKKKGLEGQFSMFDFGAINDDVENNMDDIKYAFVEKEEFSEKELLSQEKEMLGIYLSGHPLSKLKEEIEKQTTISTRDIDAIDNKTNIDEENIPELEMVSGYDLQKASKFRDGQEVKIAGIITSIKKKFTKTNRIMAFVTIEDLYGQAEIIAFENAYLTAKDSLIEENIVLIKGRLSIREEEKTSIIANEITNISGASSILKESYVTYCNEAKIALGVPADIIEKFTVYSQETAIEMAKAVKLKAKSNIGIGVTGQLGRIDPANPVDTLNHVWFAVCYNDNLVVKEIIVDDCERYLQKSIVINTIANTLIEIL